jgi:hypothetical protein
MERDRPITSREATENSKQFMTDMFGDLPKDNNLTSQTGGNNEQIAIESNGVEINQYANEGQSNEYTSQLGLSPDEIEDLFREDPDEPKRGFVDRSAPK